MKNKPINVIFGILMIAALIGGIMLAGQSQETRKGAYFAGTKMLIMPESVTAGVGEDLVTQLFLETESGAKLSAVDTTICYGAGLELDADNPENQVVLNTNALKDLVDVSLDTIADKPCVRVVALAGASMKPTDLKSGMVRAFNIKFKATEVNGGGTISILSEKTKIGGYNPSAGATDNSLRVGVVTDATYVVTEGTDTACTNDNDCVANEYCNQTSKTCQPCSSRPACLDATPACVLDIAEGSPPICPIRVTPTPSEDVFLNFKMSFYGVSGDALCADREKMPVDITVRANNGIAKTYNNIIPVSVSGGVYVINLKLEDFPYRNDLAVFVKGPKHLQVKYGKNNQDSYYNVAGGELNGLTANAATSPLFDFSKYPLLGGDVTGSSGVRDGVVDGLDFSYVKTEAVDRTEVAEHGYMQADLNGNCKMESQDLSNMMLSLSVKQGQLY